MPVGKLRSGSALVDLQSGENQAIGGSSVTVDLPPSPAASCWCAEGGRQQKGLHSGALFMVAAYFSMPLPRSSRRGRDRGLGPVAPVFQPIVHPRRRL